jgi:hypothetical protein
MSNRFFMTDEKSLAGVLEAGTALRLTLFPGFAAGDILILRVLHNRQD